MAWRGSWRQLHFIDWPLFLAAAILIAFGLAAIYSVELSRPDSDFLNLKKQLIALALSGAAALAAALYNFRLLRNYARLMYGAGVLLLIAVLIFGTAIRGTTGWFAWSVFRFQPVEFMKMALVVALAAYFAGRARHTIGWRQLGESALITAVPMVLTLLQPDFGSAILLIGTWLILLVFAGARRQHWLALLGAGAVLGLIFWNFVLADYQKARLTSFLNPELDPLGQSYNVTQAIIAVGSGGWFGRGLGFGSQSQLKFLPESQTDFIFAVVAEELGFLGVTLIIMCFTLVFWRLNRLAARTNDDFTSFLTIGIGGVIFLQFFINIAMNIGLAPVTGITLPLVSYGGSSLLFTLIMLGVVQSAAIRLRQASV
jgi:rod shape determining protein RodA